MTIADWCILAAVPIYLLTLAPIKPLGYRDFDNRAPRDPAFYVPPLRARVLGAHNNGIETFPFFAAAILLAEFKHGAQPMVDGLAVGFLLVRLGLRRGLYRRLADHANPALEPGVPAERVDLHLACRVALRATGLADRILST